MGPIPDSRAARRIGVFGGTFDPVHNGHLAIAGAVRRELDLDVVLFVVAADQWLRDQPPEAGAADRYAMAELAVEHIPGSEASDIDIARGAPTYTVDTLADLRERFGTAAELHLLVGADSALSMGRWYRAEKIASLARVVVVGRPGSALPAFESAPPAHSHPAKGAVYVEGPMVDVSATEVRELVRAGRSIASLVPAMVADYIGANGLYR